MVDASGGRTSTDTTDARLQSGHEGTIHSHRRDGESALARETDFVGADLDGSRMQRTAESEGEMRREIASVGRSGHHYRVIGERLTYRFGGDPTENGR